MWVALFVYAHFKNYIDFNKEDRRDWHKELGYFRKIVEVQRLKRNLLISHFFSKGHNNLAASRIIKSLSWIKLQSQTANPYGVVHLNLQTGETCLVLP